MNSRLWLALGAFVIFGAFTAYVIGEVGYVGIWRAGLANWGALQILGDLGVVCTLAILWLINDARVHGRNPWPYVVAIMFGGSLGVLGYLVVGEWGSAQRVAHIA
jgi:hypothetical protein